MDQIVGEEDIRNCMVVDKVNHVLQEIATIHDMDFLKLSEKFHLRYFALHIEDLSKADVKVAEQLSVMAIKRNL